MREGSERSVRNDECPQVVYRSLGKTLKGQVRHLHKQIYLYVENFTQAGERNVVKSLQRR